MTFRSVRSGDRAIVDADETANSNGRAADRAARGWICDVPVSPLMPTRPPAPRTKIPQPLRLTLPVALTRDAAEIESGKSTDEAGTHRVGRSTAGGRSRIGAAKRVGADQPADNQRAACPPLALELVMGPGLGPASPPALPIMPPPAVTFPLALEFANQPGPEETDMPLRPQVGQPVSTPGKLGPPDGPPLMPTSPPAMLSMPPVTVAPEDRPLIDPPFSPMRPPTLLLNPPVTAPVEVELTIVPLGKLEPAMTMPGGTPSNTTFAPTRPPAHRNRRS